MLPLSSSKGFPTDKRMLIRFSVGRTFFSLYSERVQICHINKLDRTVGGKTVTEKQLLSHRKTTRI
jgi:hypothetical protein